MEYSKEDLMEAKKQIWGVGENMGTEESKNVCRDLRQLPASMQTQYRRFPARSRKRTQAASRLSFRDLRYSLSQPLRLI